MKKQCDLIFLPSTPELSDRVVAIDRDGAITIGAKILYGNVTLKEGWNWGFKTVSNEGDIEHFNIMRDHFRKINDKLPFLTCDVIVAAKPHIEGVALLLVETHEEAWRYYQSVSGGIPTVEKFIERCKDDPEFEKFWANNVPPIVYSDDVEQLAYQIESCFDTGDYGGGQFDGNKIRDILKAREAKDMFTVEQMLAFGAFMQTARTRAIERLRNESLKDMCATQENDTAIYEQVNARTTRDWLSIWESDHKIFKPVTAILEIPEDNTSVYVDSWVRKTVVI